MFLDRAKGITQPVDSLKLGRVTETRNVIQAYSHGVAAENNAGVADGRGAGAAAACGSVRGSVWFEYVFEFGDRHPQPYPGPCNWTQAGLGTPRPLPLDGTIAPGAMFFREYQERNF